MSLSFDQVTDSINPVIQYTTSPDLYSDQTEGEYLVLMTPGGEIVDAGRKGTIDVNCRG